MDTAAKIRKAFIDYVLNEEKKPQSAYKLSKSIKIKEEDFYDHYNSLEGVENDIWRGFFVETKERLESEEVYASYSVREKMLAFYFTWIEVLKSNRSFIQITYSEFKVKYPLPHHLKAFKSAFLEFIQELLLEGRETEEVVERPYIVDLYPRIFWAQALLVTNFWIKDHSPSFEKTDVFIEKAVNFAFDAMGPSSLDSAFDFFKFAFQNR